MENKTTLDFLKTASVAVVASADNKMLKDFLSYISVDCNAAELSIADSIQYDCEDNSNELKIATVNKIKTLKEINACRVVPVEFSHRERYVTALLRSLYFRIPESEKQDIQMFKLHYLASDLRLECEFGENAGWYIVYDYDQKTGMFTERM